ncbi:MAG: 1-acyl-sn-glycerol-3-phosphate acyltransferase [Saprospiraceae bacterium]|nr:1-acyl-sn-glycerol-3-phosphate acyltransferase [Saprospiraceae bacterium]
MQDEQEISGIEITENFINIEEVFKSKSPAAKALPRFILNYLKRIIHEKEINALLYNNRNTFNLEFVEEVVKEFKANISITNVENIPKEGRALVASNHPLGGLDGIALLHKFGEVRKDVVFPVNDILLFIPQLKGLLIPINKHGKNTENIKIIDDTFTSEKLILYFPSGMVSRKHKDGIYDLDWKHTFITKAVKYKRDVIPVFIDGKNSNFFYGLARIRKMLNIKANIEMLYLPNEMYKQHNKNINIIVGKPIPYETFNKSLKAKEWAKKVQKYAYSLEKNPKQIFNPEL